MNKTIVEYNAIEEAQQQIFDIILTLPDEQQNDMIKNIRSLFIAYRFKKVREAETELKRRQNLLHTLTI